MQVWKKLGLLFSNHIPGFTHAAVPLAYPTGAPGLYHLIFSARDSTNRSRPFSLVFDLPKLKLLEIREKPILALGNPGHFDSDGVMPTSLINKGRSVYMFYIGWNRGMNVPFRNALGLAISHDYGQSFQKVSHGPILDRSIYDPCFVAGCDILDDHDHYVMWYLSGLRWTEKNGNWQPSYHIKTALSKDLLEWERRGKVAIDFCDDQEYAIASPRVLKFSEHLYRMWYSYRGASWAPAYRIGYAESVNGRDWKRKDAEIDIPLGTTWDSEMTCYPFMLKHEDRLYMLYNGNGYGKTGIGLAVLQNE